MLNWRARNPSTASVTPATTKTMKANSVLLVEINQMQSGTRKSLAMEMRLGMVIGWLISAPAACFFQATHGIARRPCPGGGSPQGEVLARLRRASLEPRTTRIVFANRRNTPDFVGLFRPTHPGPRRH